MRYVHVLIAHFASLTAGPSATELNAAFPYARAVEDIIECKNVLAFDARFASCYRTNECDAHVDCCQNIHQSIGNIVLKVSRGLRHTFAFNTK